MSLNDPLSFLFLVGVTIFNRAQEEMGHEFKAGAEFTHQKCLLVHGNIISGSHVDTSFFKVMFGKQFSNFMV